MNNIQTQEQLREFLKERNQKAYEVYCKYKEDNPNQAFFDVYEFAQNIGIRFVADPVETSPIVSELDSRTISNLSSIIYQNKVWINPEKIATKKRLTLSHEIGHYIDAGKDIDSLEEFDTGVYFRTKDQNKDSAYTEEELRVDRKIDNFVATLLIDETILKTKIKALQSISKNHRDSRMVSMLALTFGVSNKAMQLRMESLQFNH